MNLNSDNFPSDWNYNVVRDGVVEIEGFYQDPDRIRAFALGCNYGGNVTTTTKSLVSDSRSPSADEVLLRLGGFCGVAPDLRQIEMLHSFWGFAACGEFQLRTECQPTVGRIHSHVTGQIAAIVSLALNRDCEEQSSTRFFRHRRLGLESFLDVGPGHYEKLKADAGNIASWVELPTVSLRYNNALIFDSRSFHAEPPGFGQSAENGRLIQIFNFSSASMHSNNQTAPRWSAPADYPGETAHH